MDKVADALGGNTVVQQRSSHNAGITMVQRPASVECVAQPSKACVKSSPRGRKIRIRVSGLHAHSVSCLRLPQRDGLWQFRCKSDLADDILIPLGQLSIGGRGWDTQRSRWHCPRADRA